MAERIHGFAKLKGWQRMLLTGVLVALSGQFYLHSPVEGFRVSLAPCLYPVFLVALVGTRRYPWTGVLTGGLVLVLRTGLAAAAGQALWPGLLESASGALFYVAYGCLMCVGVPEGEKTGKLRLFAAILCSDLLSNLLDLWVSARVAGMAMGGVGIGQLALLAAARALLASALMAGAEQYRSGLLRQEHIARYHRLFLMTAGLKNEVYFLKKDADEIERVMSNAYRLYESLKEMPGGQGLRELALGIARDVHEVKKDNLRIIRGIEGELEEVYDQEEMRYSDLIDILEDSTRRMLGADSGIQLRCVIGRDFRTRRHYQLMSVLKNLVTNAIEAIQTSSGTGVVEVEQRDQGDQMLFRIEDNGPGIRAKNREKIFCMGFSTKFDPETGNINRGVGLAAVASIVDELGGSISVDSQEGAGTRFLVTLPRERLEEGVSK